LIPPITHQETEWGGQRILAMGTRLPTLTKKFPDGRLL